MSEKKYDAGGIGPLVGMSFFYFLKIWVNFDFDEIGFYAEVIGLF